MRHRGMRVEAPHPLSGTVPLVASPIRLSATPVAEPSAPPTLGQHTAEVLAGEARAQAWQQVITTVPSYAAYEKRTKREIPLVVLHPAQ